MKRNMDLIRELLLKLEGMPIAPGAVMHLRSYDDEMKMSGYEDAEVEYHLNLIVEAGLIDTGGLRAMEGIGFRALTWAGHDFVDSIRNPEVWAKTKQGALAAGGFTMDLLKDLAKGLLKKLIEDKTGVKL